MKSSFQRKDYKSMSKIFLVPGINESENITMYCNYARMNPYEERCLICDQSDCEHKGKHTIIER